MVIGDLLEEEDQVIYLLASLPESFDMLVTALEVNADVPKYMLYESICYMKNASRRGWARSVKGLS